MFTFYSVKYYVGKIISEQAQKLITNVIHSVINHTNNTILLNQQQWKNQLLLLIDSLKDNN